MIKLKVKSIKVDKIFLENFNKISQKLNIKIVKNKYLPGAN